MTRKIASPERPRRCCVTAAVLMAVACSRADPPRSSFVIEVRGGAISTLEWSSPASILSAERFVDRVELRLDPTRAPDRLTLSAKGYCSEELTLSGARGGERRRLELTPWLSVAAGDAAQLGFDSPFSVTLKPGCRAAVAGKVTWQQTSGAPLQIQTDANGFVLRGRTKPLALDGALPWGIVPLSPRTRGQVTFEARWQGGSRSETLAVRLASAARAPGLPSIAVGQRVLLGGNGWAVKAPAKGGTAAVTPMGSLATFLPDTRGRWLLADGEGRELSIVAGSHAETPLDCGRSDCHTKETRLASGTKMTSSLSRAVAGGVLGLPHDCALGCHVAGEPGLADGGFAHLQREMGLAGVWPTPEQGWDALPRPLRRLGGVTCTACHGPGAIPEPSARWSILRTDVCATCHDAPPRYGHVVAWKKSRMARADADPTARSSSECRPCHTTAGFLAARNLRKDDGSAPADLVTGVACAACHAPHGAHLWQALVRELPAPAQLGSIPKTFGSGTVCLPCHAAAERAGGTAARILLGGKDPPHAQVVDGCVGCHYRRVEGTTARGQGHDFRAEMSTCTRGCHEGGAPQRDPALRTRAERLYAELGGVLDPKRPPHAQSTDASVGGIESLGAKRFAALQWVLEVIEDPAADVHNPVRARDLLDRAERELAAQRR